MAEDKELNNLETGSEEGTTKDKTEGDKKDEGGKDLPEKFKSKEAHDASYQELEAARTKDRQEISTLRERLAKLEGAAEAQKKQPTGPPPLTEEQRQAMSERFKEDFNKDPLPALHNFVSPYTEEARLAREEVAKLREENETIKKTVGDQNAVFLAGLARQEDPKLFDQLKPEIDKELREDKNLLNYENPYEAAFNKVAGKSYKKLAKMTDAEREAFVEGPSQEPPKTDKKKAYVKKIVDAKVTTRL